MASASLDLVAADTRRPAFSVLDCRMTWDVIGHPAKHWRENLSAAIQERARTGSDFFRGLPDEDDRALPLILQLREDARYADEGGHVNVVSAGVHYADLFSVVVRRRVLARIRDAGFFRYR